MSELYRLTRDVTREECHWLEEDFKTGDIVTRCNDYAYGVISENGMAFTKRTVQTINNVEIIMNSPFFELPKNAVEPV